MKEWLGASSIYLYVSLFGIDADDVRSVRRRNCRMAEDGSRVQSADLE